MKKALVILAGLSLLSACVVTLPKILKVDPVRTATFKGSHVELADCLRVRPLSGKVEKSLDETRIDVYGARKLWTNFGVSHYAVSIFKDGTLELRKLPRGELSEAGAEKLWTPIEDCIRRVAAG